MSLQIPVPCGYNQNRPGPVLSCSLQTGLVDLSLPCYRYDFYTYKSYTCPLAGAWSTLECLTTLYCLHCSTLKWTRVPGVWFLFSSSTTLGGLRTKFVSFFKWYWDRIRHFSQCNLCLLCNKCAVLMVYFTFSASLSRVPFNQFD